MSIRGLILLLVVTVAGGCVYVMNSHFSGSIGVFADAAQTTLALTFWASILAFVFAFVSGLGKLSTLPPVRWLATAYIEIFRGSSALVQLFWLFYVLPLFGPRIDPFTAGVLGVALNVGAYGGVLVEAAIRAVPRGQQEASIALNLSRWQRMRYVVLPQALVLMIPPWGNLLIQLFKLTALVSFIGISDLTYTANQLNQTTYRTVEVFTIILFFYFSIGLVITIAMRSLAKHVNGDLALGGSR